MLNANVAELLNQQIVKELYSAYLYLEFSNFYDEQSLEGFKNYFYIQAQEERDHAMLIMQYLQQNGAHVTLGAIDAPDADLKELIDPLKKAYEHELYVTGLINDCYGAAYEVKDFRTMQFLDWFVKEQAEEEDNASKLVDKFTLFGTNGSGLHSLDSDLGARVYTAPSLVVG